MVDLSTSLKYYKRPEIQEAIAKEAEKKEVGVFIERISSFGRRPDSIVYPSDVLEFAKKGATSFHFSEELWENPLALMQGVSKKNIDSLRTGWDLIIDIDAVFDFSKICAFVIANALEYHGIKHYSIKFSGNKGFHIGVPFEAFPSSVSGVKIKDLFPEGAVRIANYLKKFMKKNLSNELLKRFDIDEIKKISGKKHDEIVSGSELDPFSFIELDTILISSRHLYRAPYSLHEKSGLASIPIKKSEVLEFDKESAKPENIKPEDVVMFFDRKNAKKNEAKELFINAFDFKPKIEEKKGEVRNYEDDLAGDVIPEDCFPPCIKKGLAGLSDGRKRFLFAFLNFIRLTGRGNEEVEKIVLGWNERNNPPLKEGYVKTQLKYSEKKKNIPPPNCDSEVYYSGLGICSPDSLCKNLKNPISYAKRKFMMGSRNKKKEKKERKRL